MKKVLIIVSGGAKRPDQKNWLELRASLQEQIPDTIVDMTAFDQLVFDVSNSEPKILDVLHGLNDIADYDLVVLRNVGKSIDLGITAAQYLAYKGIPFMDSYLEMRGSGKLACAMLRVRSGLPTPRTVYGSAALLQDYLNANHPFEYPFILKADNGKKGRDNYLVQNSDELAGLLRDQDTVHFIAQEYIQNDGDYRVLVLDGKIALAIHRTAADGSHLNNTSQGGTAELVGIERFSEAVRADILRAAEVEGLQVAGVDIIFDSRTDAHYFLEVNRAPQLDTGSFVDEKVTEYAKMITARLGGKQ